MSKHTCEGCIDTMKERGYVVTPTGDGPMAMPVYRLPRGGFQTISGPAAESWPYPQKLVIDGRLYVERVLPETGWGVTFHAVRSYRTPIGVFLDNYWEGRSSGFPWWPVVVFSARSAWRFLR